MEHRRFLAELARGGVEVSAEGSDLVVRGKRPTDRQRAYLRENKAGIIAELAPRTAPAPPPLQREAPAPAPVRRTNSPRPPAATAARNLSNPRAGSRGRVRDSGGRFSATSSPAPDAEPVQPAARPRRGFWDRVMWGDDEEDDGD